MGFLFCEFFVKRVLKKLNYVIIKTMEGYKNINNKNNLIRKIINYCRKNPKKVRILLIAIVILVVISIGVSIIVEESKKQKYVIYNGENLNEEKYPGYKELIDKLQENHPNWTFTLFYTKLDWNEVIENEGHIDGNLYPSNLVPDSSDYPDDWKCEIDKDKRFDNGTWLCASDKAIKYKMDPRNILNEENIFQFKELNYVENAQTVEGLKEITSGSFLEGDSICRAIIEAGKNSNLDPYFIASRLIQEQGRKGTTMSKGYEYNGAIVYNPFNINAIGNSRDEILNNAAIYAYEKGWDSLEKAIVGGIGYMKEGYINEGQNTLYLQKFDVVKIEGLYKHQYMQNLLAPTSEANNMKSIYEYSNMVDSNLNFIIPLYENMPEEISEE